MRDLEGRREPISDPTTPPAPAASPSHGRTRLFLRFTIVPATDEDKCNQGGPLRFVLIETEEKDQS